MQIYICIFRNPCLSFHWHSIHVNFIRQLHLLVETTNISLSDLFLNTHEDCPKRKLLLSSIAALMLLHIHYNLYNFLSFSNHKGMNSENMSGPCFGCFPSLKYVSKLEHSNLAFSRKRHTYHLTIHPLAFKNRVTVFWLS